MKKSRTMAQFYKLVLKKVKEYKKFQKNPLFVEDRVMDDAIKVAEHRFKKPFPKFNEPEHKFVQRLYNKANNNRLSLKRFPDDPSRQLFANPSFLKTAHDERIWKIAEKAYKLAAHRREINGEPEIKDKWAYIGGIFQNIKGRS